MGPPRKKKARKVASQNQVASQNLKNVS